MQFDEIDQTNSNEYEIRQLTCPFLSQI